MPITLTNPSPPLYHVVLSNNNQLSFIQKMRTGLQHDPCWLFIIFVKISTNINFFIISILHLPSSSSQESICSSPRLTHINEIMLPNKGQNCESVVSNDSNNTTVSRKSKKSQSNRGSTNTASKRLVLTFYYLFLWLFAICSSDCLLPAPLTVY